MSFIKAEKGSSVFVQNCTGIRVNDTKFVEADNDCDVSIINNKFIINNNIKDDTVKIHKAVKERGKNKPCLCGSGKKSKDCCLGLMNKLNLNKSKNICLIIGNGLNYSVRSYLDKKNMPINMDSSHFFKWDIKSMECNKKFIEDLPTLKKYINESDLFREYMENLGNERKINSFDIVEDLNKKAYENIKKNIDVKEAKIMLEELKYYIAIAFSYFQLEINKKNLSEWIWVKLFKLMRGKISYIISLNYELVLEQALEYAGLKYRREGLNEEKQGFGILKPHGSIDYDVKGIDVHVQLPIKSLIYRNDFPIRKINKNNLLSKRTEIDIVLPMEKSYQSNYQWIKPGYDKIKDNGKKIDHLIICGVSYWGCDRSEIDRIIDSINNNSIVTVINPNVNEELQNKLRSKFKQENIFNINLEQWVEENL